MKRAFLFTVVLLSGVCAAQVEVSYPLQGYYHPGRYMPVRLSGPAGTQRIEISAEGAVRTELFAGGIKLDATAPWLLGASQPAKAEWSADGTRGEIAADLHALNDDEQLIALIGEHASGFATKLFPNSRVIPIQLDAATPLPGPLSAWESLDALIVDSPSAARITQAQLAGLVAAGTVVAVHSHDRPGGAWPWRQIDDYWVLRFEPAGPRGVIVPAAYSSMEALSATWPSSFGWQLVLFVLLFSLAMLALSLWRSRYALLTMVLTVAATLVLLSIWRGRQSALVVATGMIAVHGDGLTQLDEWIFRETPVASHSSLAVENLTHPIFASSAHLKAAQIRLLCAADGQPVQFLTTLRPRTSLAFRHRSLATELPQTLMHSLPSPLLRLARDTYLKRGDRIAGVIPPREKPADALMWPGVLIERAAP